MSIINNQVSVAAATLPEGTPEWQQVMRAVQDQFKRFGNNLPDGFDSRVVRWVDDLMAGVPLKPTVADDFSIEDDRELELLLNLSADMAAGRCNQDTGIWWLETLEKVLARLKQIPAVVEHQLTVAHEPSRGGWSVGAVVDGEFKWLAHDESVEPAIAAAITAKTGHAEADSLPLSNAPVDKLTRWLASNPNVGAGLEGGPVDVAIQALSEYQFLQSNWLASDHPKVWEALTSRNSMGLSRAIRAALADRSKGEPAAY
ncbi:hypothetical protein ABIC83_003051 [Roseateles asaccharophilus]|uniref:hypothetical protein n=1 Tax=Roseateles asaccharophilus TaxID=582607 RepID=UPI0038323FB0